MKSELGRGSCFIIEGLEGRTLLSVALEQDAANPTGADARGGPVFQAPPIRLDLVALHEFGHSLGLAHNSNPNSIMYAYYNANYNLSAFASDPAVAQLQQMFTASNVDNNLTSWKNSLDGNPGNHTIDLTYSFVPDGAKMDQGTSNTFATFDKLFGANQWQSIFAAALNLWASVSNGALSFSKFDADGVENAIYGFNTSGATQHDSRFGDLRIGAHKMDTSGGTLAHTYYPPPNGSTAAGDSHYDSTEKWVLASGSSSNLNFGDKNGKAGALVMRHSSPFATGPSIGAADSQTADSDDLIAVSADLLQA